MQKVVDPSLRINCVTETISITVHLNELRCYLGGNFADEEVDLDVSGRLRTPVAQIETRFCCVRKRGDRPVEFLIPLFCVLQNDLSSLSENEQEISNNNTLPDEDKPTPVT